eukprot:g369.t1
MNSEASYYDVLELTPDASQNEIRKAYLRKARESHPDKNPNESAKLRFQHLQKVYSVLSCPTSRALYDQSGETEVEGVSSRTPITEEDITSFAKEYFLSDVEKEDLLMNYSKLKGNMKKVFEVQILSDEKLDAHRFMRMIKSAVNEGVVKEYKRFLKWSERVSKTKEIEFSLEHRLKQDEPDGQLIALINSKSRGADFMSHVNDLESKYCSKSAKYDDIDDEEFEKIQSQLMSSTANQQKTKDKPQRKKLRKT